jgi:hypothetical protein
MFITESETKESSLVDTEEAVRFEATKKVLAITVDTESIGSTTHGDVDDVETEDTWDYEQKEILPGMSSVSTLSGKTGPSKEEKTRKVILTKPVVSYRNEYPPISPRKQSLWLKMVKNAIKDAQLGFVPRIHVTHVPPDFSISIDDNLSNRSNSSIVPNGCGVTRENDVSEKEHGGITTLVRYCSDQGWLNEDGEQRQDTETRVSQSLVAGSLTGTLESRDDNSISSIELLYNCMTCQESELVQNDPIEYSDLRGMVIGPTGQMMDPRAMPDGMKLVVQNPYKSPTFAVNQSRASPSLSASASGRSVSGRSVSGRSVSGRSVSGHSVSGHSVSGRSVSGRSVPGRSVLGRSVPGRSNSSRSASVAGGRGGSKGKQSRRRRTKPRRVLDVGLIRVSM